MTIPTHTDLNRLLEENANQPARCRRTIRQICDVLQESGYEGGYDSVTYLAHRAIAMAAFERAIASGRLSKNPDASNFAGDYMYMGDTVDGQHDAFKHSTTRQYLAV